MYASVRSSKSSENHDNFTRQGSLRRVIPAAHNKDNLFGRQNEDLNKVYKIYRQEYIILAEYKMIQSENIQGVYVIPSRENSLVWFGVIFVRSGPYEDGIFRFTMLLDENFPDGAHPKVVFQSELFHPVITADSHELHLLDAFPMWNKNEQHLWQILKYIQWIFHTKLDACLPHAVNKEATELYQNNPDAFNKKVKEIIEKSKERLYDDPPTEDKHYITFTPIDGPDLHDKIKNTMLNYQEEEQNKKGVTKGHSWVLPGSFKSLSRPPSPQSESES